jgi:hypothetical protein
MHAEGHLRLAAVASEMALAHKETEQEPDSQIVLLVRQILVGGGYVGGCLRRHEATIDRVLFHRQVARGTLPCGTIWTVESFPQVLASQ